MHHLDQLFGNGETKACSAILARRRAVGLREGLKEPALDGFRNPYSRINHLDPNASVIRRLRFTTDVDEYFAVFGEFNCIANEV